MKVKCSQCNEIKDLADFYKCKSKKNGHHTYCKVCARKYDAVRYYNSKPKRLLKDKIYYQKPGVKQQKIKSNLKMRLLYPEKAKARQDLRNAITAGKIKRLACEVCGEKKTHAHHTDYTKPFDVEWLCVQHHYERHRKYTQFVGK